MQTEKKCFKIKHFSYICVPVFGNSQVFDEQKRQKLHYTKKKMSVRTEYVTCTNDSLLGHLSD